MFRVKLILIVLGGGLAFWGFQEFKVSQGTSEEPVTADLSKLEAGDPLPNNHIRVGEHFCVYDELIYEYEESSFGSSVPDQSTTVTCAYYPIVSNSHPYVERVREIFEQVAKQPSGAVNLSPPRLRSFAVLVKTRRFGTVGDLEGGIDTADSLTGLVVNRVHSLGSEEKKLIAESMPGVDPDKILILEEGRQPASALKSFGMMGGGALLMLIGLGLFFVGGSES